MATTTKHKTPKHLTVAQALRGQIESGELKVGDRLPSYAQALEIFGAHTVTLEKAHALLESEGLIIRERGRGTFVAPRARKGRKNLKKTTGIVGLAGIGFEFAPRSSYWTEILGAMNCVAREAGKQILLLDAQSSKGWEKADGVLICDWSKHAVLKMVPPSLPCVSLLVPIEGMASVFADDWSGGQLAAEHLLGLGHTKLAFLHAPDDSVLPLRRAGWLAALEAAHIEADPRWERVSAAKPDYGASFAANGRDEMRRWLAEDWDELDCTAILAHNDHTALGIIEALREGGKRVPGDVSVMGFDGGEICDYVSPRLCSVEVPIGAIAAKAMKMLLERLDGAPATNEQCALNVRLQHRETTGPAPV